MRQNAEKTQLEVEAWRPLAAETEETRVQFRCDFSKEIATGSRGTDAREPAQGFPWRMLWMCLFQGKPRGKSLASISYPISWGHDGHGGQHTYGGLVMLSDPTCRSIPAEKGLVRKVYYDGPVWKWKLLDVFARIELNVNHDWDILRLQWSIKRIDLTPGGNQIWTKAKVLCKAEANCSRVARMAMKMRQRRTAMCYVLHQHYPSRGKILAALTFLLISMPEICWWGPCWILVSIMIWILCGAVVYLIDHMWTNHSVFFLAIPRVIVSLSFTQPTFITGFKGLLISCYIHMQISTYDGLHISMVVAIELTTYWHLYGEP